MDKFVSVPNCFRLTPHGGHEVGKPKEAMTATLSLRNIIARSALDNRIEAIRFGREGFITPEELPKWFGASDQDIETVTRELERRGFSVQQEWSDRCFGNVRLKGEPEQFERLFNVQLVNFVNSENPGDIFRGPKWFDGRSPQISLPASLADVIKSVHRLDKSPVANAKYVKGAFAQKSTGRAVSTVLPHSFAALYPSQIYALQGVPVEQLWKSGVRLATFFISLGGDNNTSVRNAIAYVAGQTGIPAAEYVALAVAGASADGDPSDGSTVENVLDGIAQAALPGTVVGISAENTDDDFCSAAEFGISSTEFDLSGGSISWGARWDNFPQATLTGRWPKIAKAATLVNRPIFIASGDNGATDQQGAAVKVKNVRGKAATKAAPKSGALLYGTDAPACVVVDGGSFVPTGGIELFGNSTAITSTGMWSSHGAAGCGVGPFPPTNNERKLGVTFKSANPGHAPGNGVPIVVDNAAPISGPLVPIPNADASDFTPQQVGGTSNAAPAACKKWVFALHGLQEPVVDFMYKQAGTSVFRRTKGAIGPYKADPKAKVDPCQGLGELMYAAAATAANS